MFRRTSFLFCLIFLLFQIESASSQIAFQCAVVTKSDGAPLDKTLVYLTSFDSSFSKFSQTDSLGRTNFVLPNTLRTKKVVLTLRRMGYRSLRDTIIVGKLRVKKYFLKEDTFFTRMMVVTAQLKPKTMDQTVHKMRVISQKEIVSQGAVTLRDVLVNENCVQVSQDNVLGSQISFQGMSGQNVKILIDGVAVIGRLDGNVDLSQINLNDIERIEIVQGPLSVSYGSDALAGTINLITKKGQRKPWSIGVNSYYETIGQYNINVRAGLKKNKHSFSLSMGRNFFDGWSSDETYTIVPKETLADTFRVQQWKPKEQLFGTVQYGWKSKKMDILYSTRVYQEIMLNRGMPRKPYFENAFDDIYATFRMDNNLSIAYKVSNKLQWDNTIGYNRYERRKNTYYVNLTDMSKELTTSASDHDTSKFNLFQWRGTFTTGSDSSKIGFQLGYDAQIESTTGKRITEGKSAMQNYAIFTTLEYSPIKSLTLRPGLRYGYNSSYDHPLIPSLSALYKRNNTSLRLSYAKGFRAPSLKELYLNFVDINHDIKGNENLKAEKSTNLQATLERKICHNKLLMTIGLNGYANNVVNRIALAQANTSEYSYFNIDYFKARGGQFNVESRVKLTNVFFGIGYTAIQNQIEGTNSSPNYSGFFEFNTRLSQYIKPLKLKASLMYKYTGKRSSYFQDSKNEIIESRIDDFHSMSMSVSKRFYKGKIQVVSGVKNIFNIRNVDVINGGTGAHQASSASMPMQWGRSVFLTINLNINGDFKKEN